MKIPDTVEKVSTLLKDLRFNGEIFYHEQAGTSTEEAVRATGLDSQQIIKCLLLKSKNNQYLGAIVIGRDRVDFRVIEHLSGYKDLRMASIEEVISQLGFEIGGVPAIIFFAKNIITYIDTKVLLLNSVVGSGGSPFYGMRFNPKQLPLLNYIPANITKRSSP